MLSPVWRNRLFALFATVVAMVLGVQIAHGAWFWPTLIAGLLAGVIAISIQPRPLLAVILAVTALGYIVGNRGFAQISLSQSFPLLPGELGLLLAGGILLVQSAWRHEMPARRDPLNVALLVWMAAGTIRVLFDIREFGFAAIRDYALVYYAAFFFLAQQVARDRLSGAFVLRCILYGCAALLVVHPLFTEYTAFFISTLTLRGSPLIFFKGDLAATLMAVGSVLAFVRYERSRQRRWLVVSLALAALMMTTSSRSSMVALAVGAGWLAIGGRWRFAGWLSLGAVVAAIALLFAAELENQSWRQTQLHRVYERVLSIADPFGQRVYQTDDAFKGDNNVFRTVWWEATVTETIEGNPWLGLGFGHDLAARFVRQYFPEGNDEFSARSPHNALITVFARMGVLGLILFLAVVGLAFLSTWHAVRRPDPHVAADGAWVGAWVMLVAACFGVVLEGPMGAMVFWTLLGLANGFAHAKTAPAEAAMAAIELTPTSPHREARLRMSSSHGEPMMSSLNSGKK